LAFTVHDDGSVSSSLHGHVALQGFHGCLHGGIIASLLDGAMTNCLFAQGSVAMTAELKVRYRKPVLIGQEMIIRAWITRSQPPLHLLEAELKQEGCIKAIASAKFLQPNDRADRNHRPGRE
jgi:acyl-coenzyme A thioesterase PaaI-like protein